jgi:hypothetical protein
MFAIILTPGIRATAYDPADTSIREFLSQNEQTHPYRATRRLEGENGGSRAWMEAVTEFSPATGFKYQITAEGGSSDVRSKMLRPLLDAERDVIARGEIARSNYQFQANGVDENGLANILLSPRREDVVLVAGTMFLRPDGELVRLQGRLAKNPSFWVKRIDIVRSYGRIDGVVLPIALESSAQLRLVGNASVRMTYSYTEINGRTVAPSLTARKR